MLPADLAHFGEVSGKSIISFLICRGLVRRAIEAGRGTSDIR